MSHDWKSVLDFVEGGDAITPENSLELSKHEEKEL
jgi:hypothetical protein